MDGGIVTFNNKIHHQLQCFGVEQLGTDPGFAPFGKSRLINVMHHTGSQVDKVGFVVLFHLIECEAPKTKGICHEQPALPAKHIAQFTAFKIFHPLVILPPEGRYGGRADFNGSIHRDGIMYTQEWVFQVWHRIDVGLDRLVLFGVFQVDPLKRDDGVLL